LGDGFVWSGNEAQAQLATVLDWKDAKTALIKTGDRSNISSAKTKNEGQVKYRGSRGQSI